MKKANTAIICLSPNSGGMEIDTIKLAKKLSPYSQIVVIAKKDAFIAQSHESYVGINNIVLETISFSSMLSFSIIINARRIIKKHNIKNVIFFGASEMKSLYFSFLGLDLNLAIRHGTTKSRPKKDWFHRLIYSEVNYHISICKHLEENVQYIIPFGKNSKSVLIYSSVKEFVLKKQKQDKPTLLHIGRIARGKGQSDAIKACEVLYKNNIDFTFYLVGGFEETYKKEFLKLYDTLPYKDSIKLVGFTNDTENYLAKSDVFLFPSHGEGLSNAFLEALSTGLFPISYHNTSFPELKELGFNFELVEDKKIEELKIALLDTVQNLDIKDKDVIENYKLVKKLFNKQNEISKYIEILQ